jgi:hypothetical protein
MAGLLSQFKNLKNCRKTIEVFQPCPPRFFFAKDIGIQHAVTIDNIKQDMDWASSIQFSRKPVYFNNSAWW